MLELFLNNIMISEFPRTNCLFGLALSCVHALAAIGPAHFWSSLHWWKNISMAQCKTANAQEILQSCTKPLMCVDTLVSHPSRDSKDSRSWTGHVGDPGVSGQGGIQAMPDHPETPMGYQVWEASRTPWKSLGWKAFRPGQTYWDRSDTHSLGPVHSNWDSDRHFQDRSTSEAHWEGDCRWPMDSRDGVEVSSTCRLSQHRSSSVRNGDHGQDDWEPQAGLDWFSAIKAWMILWPQGPDSI